MKVTPAEVCAAIRSARQWGQVGPRGRLDRTLRQRRRARSLGGGTQHIVLLYMIPKSPAIYEPAVMPGGRANERGERVGRLRGGRGDRRGGVHAGWLAVYPDRRNRMWMKARSMQRELVCRRDRDLNGRGHACTVGNRYSAATLAHQHDGAPDEQRRQHGEDARLDELDVPVVGDRLPEYVAFEAVRVLAISKRLLRLLGIRRRTTTATGCIYHCIRDFVTRAI